MSPQPALETGLRGLDPVANYDVTFARTYDVGEKRRMTGEQLRHMRVEIDSKPGSLLIRYQQADGVRQ
jgi:hypothetical protein